VNPFLTLKRHAEEDEDERKLCKNVEPLVMRLERGINCFTEPEFTWLAKYMLPEDERDRAHREQKFCVGEITIARVIGELITVSDLAKETGVPRTTLTDWVVNSGIMPVKRGCKKLYNRAELVAVLTERAA
jgi:hypothetical protein